MISDSFFLSSYFTKFFPSTNTRSLLKNRLFFCISFVFCSFLCELLFLVPVNSFSEHKSLIQSWILLGIYACIFEDFFLRDTLVQKEETFKEIFFFTTGYFFGTGVFVASLYSSTNFLIMYLKEELSFWVVWFIKQHFPKLFSKSHLFFFVVFLINFLYPSFF